MRLTPAPSPRTAAPSAEVRRAWLRYLAEVRAADAAEYGAVEERAWARLASNLAALGRPLAGADR